MQLSVIILNYKVPYHLLLCLESVQRSLKGMEAEIIVVDNNSQDESCEWVEKFFPQVKLIANSGNDGFSKGNNIGIDEAQGKYICLLNPDTVIGENTFKNLLEFAENHPDFGSIGPKLIDGRGRFLPESKRNIPTPKIALKKLLFNGKSYYSELDENESGAVEILAGAFMLMRKDRYFEVGKLDEDYFMYGEDIDLSYKFLKAGYQNYYVGSEPVLHFKGESSAKDEVYRKRFYDAMMIFYQKHFQKNIFSRYLVQLGLNLAKMTHGWRQPAKPEEELIYGFLCIDYNPQLAVKLEKKFQVEVRIIKPEEVEQKNPEEEFIIFNAETLSYQKILHLIQLLGKQDNKFRIKPMGFKFFLGSDHTLTQGEVLQL